jgi:hypothetical protein
MGGLLRLHHSPFRLSGFSDRLTNSFAVIRTGEDDARKSSRASFQLFFRMGAEVFRLLRRH